MVTFPETFRDERWLRQHVFRVLDFYYPDCIDHRYGGYIAHLSDRDGHVYDGRAKHLVSSCRLVFDFGVGALLDGPDWCYTAAGHGVNFLLDEWRQGDGGYPWLLSGREVADPRRTCYGHAFVLLAYATAAKAGVPRAHAAVHETADLVVERFWEDEHDLCRGTLTADWEEPTAAADHRGQNENMHVCEAFLAAYEATGEDAYLDRAFTVAERLARDIADEGDGLVWEHYTGEWEIDWTPGDHPRGYLTGHLFEWAKLLCQLAEHRDADWLVPRAERLFEAGVEYGWDDDRGGFVYRVGRDGEPLETTRQYWPACEAIGASARLAAATGEDDYWTWYDRVWTDAWETLVNRAHGNWYYKVTPDGALHEDLDPTPRYKAGYHATNACYEVLRATAE